ncbi:MAG: cbb3-type cytochrome oxidase assembly protein [Puniceicoccaceae bacterium]
MEEAWWSNLLLAILGVGALLFTTAVLALFWASRNGQMNNFEAGAKTIFDEEEPEGQQTDFFPGEGEKSQDAATRNNG